jgi:putative spermidine/putrescine transport system ATP-binding protein
VDRTLSFQVVRRFPRGPTISARAAWPLGEGLVTVLFGPSGSGKTTVLRALAGLDRPDGGRIDFGGEPWFDAARGLHLAPQARGVGLLFQDYALFPHLSVLENVGYGLAVRGVARGERARQAEAALEQVALGGYGARRPGQLSGGQRQRVALARALVNRPRVLLLDEPLGALDLKLREQMQVELKGLQRRLGITFVYVTHDQGEALSMSDRVAVFNRGRIEQIDTPRGLYARPRTVFVAGFVGTANVLTGALARRVAGGDRPLSVRPEHIRLGDPEAGQVGVIGRLVDVQFHGPVSRWEVDVDGTPMAVSVPCVAGEPARPPDGAPVHLSWPRAAMVELEPAA